MQSKRIANDNRQIMAKSILKCYKAYLKYPSSLHCQISEQCIGWGCKYLLSIAHENSCIASKYWYEFGYFENNKFEKWIVDKTKITSILQNEVDKLDLSQCQRFDIKEVLDKINLLANEIIVDNIYWTLLENSETKEIIGVAHLENMDFDINNKDLISTTDWDSIFPTNTPKYTPK